MSLRAILRDAPRSPVSSLISLAAIIVSISWWSGHDISALVPTSDTILSRPWTLVTSIFPHVNVPHLFFNLWACWIFFTAVERVWGRLRLIGIIILFAITSSAAEFALEDGGVGLSGVGYGLCTLLFIAQRKVPALQGVVTRKTLEVFAVWFVLCIVLTFANIMRVGNIAHGAGALAGWLLGMAVIAEPSRRTAWLASLTALLALSCFGATAARPWINLSNPPGYTQAVQGYKALRDNRFEDAIPLLESAVKARPRDSKSLVNLGHAYQATKRYAQAAETYRQVLAIDPSERPNLCEYIGASEYLAGHFGDAIPWLEEAIALPSATAGDFQALGMAYQKKDRHLDALAPYKRAVALDPAKREELAPSIASILDNKAAAAANHGDRPTARLLSEESLRWNPEDDYAKRMLDWSMGTNDAKPDTTNP